MTPTYAPILPSDKEEEIVPKIISEASRVTTPVQEFYSPEHTIISGLRLRDLCAEGENVVFGSGSLTVSIPSKLLLAQKLTDSDTLSVKLSQLENNQVLLEVSAFEKPVNQLPGSIIRLGYIAQSKNVDINVYNPRDTVLADTIYDGETLHFKGEIAGIYKIVETPAKEVNTEATKPIEPKEPKESIGPIKAVEVLEDEEPQKASFPLLPLLGALILATGGMTLFWRKRNG